MILACTGPRPQNMGGFKIPNPTYVFVCQQIEKHLLEIKPTKVISGMALGCDQYFAFIANKLKIPFIAAVPFVDQEKKWSTEDQKKYNKLLSLATDIVVVTEEDYKKNSYQLRNIWMVNNSDMLLAIHPKENISNGTANCIAYAESIQKPIVHIIFEN